MGAWGNVRSETLFLKYSFWEGERYTWATQSAASVARWSEMQESYRGNLFHIDWGNGTSTSSSRNCHRSMIPNFSVLSRVSSSHHSERAMTSKRIINLLIHEYFRSDWPIATGAHFWGDARAFDDRLIFHPFASSFPAKLISSGQSKTRDGRH